MEKRNDNLFFNAFYMDEALIDVDKKENKTNY